MKRKKVRLTIFLLAIAFASVAAIGKNKRLWGFNIYFWNNGACHLLIPNSDFFTNQGVWQSYLRDKRGNIFWLWVDSDCEAPAFFNP